MPQKRAAQPALTAQKGDETKIISVPAQQHVATRVSAETSKPPQRVDSDARVVMKELPTVEKNRRVPKVAGSTMTLSKNRSVGGGLVRSPTSHPGQPVQPKPFVAGVVQQVPVPPHIPQQQPLQTVLPMPGQAPQQQQQQYFYNYQQQPVQQWASAQYPQQYYYYNYASQAYQPAYYTAATQRPFPARMVPEPQLRHPYSEGSLLTLPQPRFPGRRR
ncbi:hypothetical protein AAVH_38645 [Aphelenchoides avenae]|nr:hypothetical protein AAVH_38645 [Aphelenchus avenae]